MRASLGVYRSVLAVSCCAGWTGVCLPQLLHISVCACKADTTFGCPQQSSNDDPKTKIGLVSPSAQPVV